jgi:hypothetical protein
VESKTVRDAKLSIFDFAKGIGFSEKRKKVRISTNHLGGCEDYRIQDELRYRKVSLQLRN